MDDDYPTYDSEHGLHPAESVPGYRGRSTPWGWIVGIIVGLGILFVVACCGGAWYLFQFGTDVLTEEVQGKLEDNPVIQEHIGAIESMEIDLAKSAATEGENVLVFRIEGDKGKGYVTVEHVTSPAGMEDIVGGSLKLDSGERLPLIDEDGLSADEDAPTTDEAAPSTREDAPLSGDEPERAGE